MSILYSLHFTIRNTCFLSFSFENNGIGLILFKLHKSTVICYVTWLTANETTLWLMTDVRITILISLLLHKKFTWPDFGGIYI